MLLVSFPEASDQQLKLEKGRRRWQTPCLTRAILRGNYGQKTFILLDLPEGKLHRRSYRRVEVRSHSHPHWLAGARTNYSNH